MSGPRLKWGHVSREDMRKKSKLRSDRKTAIVPRAPVEDGDLRRWSCACGKRWKSRVRIECRFCYHRGPVSEVK